MNRIRLIVLCVVIILACAGIATSFLVREQGPQITEEQCERLQPGMTEDEVAKILGGPPDDFEFGPVWHGLHGSKIEVLFDGDGKLINTSYHAPTPVWVRIRNLFIPPRRMVIVDTDGASSIRPLNDPERDKWQHPEEIIAALALKPGATVADIGEKTFYMVTHLSKAVGKGGTVIEIDTSSSMADFLARYADDLGPAKIVLRKVGPDAPELPTASVDGVLMLDEWLHVKDKEACAKKVYEGLKRGGRFVVVEYKVDAEIGPLKEIRLEPGQVSRQLEEAGFRVTIVRSSMPRQHMIVGRKD